MYRLIHAQVEHIVNVQAIVPDIKHLRLESLAAAFFADHCNVCHKLHFNAYDAVALALRAAPSLGIEAEIGRTEMIELGRLLF